MGEKQNIIKPKKVQKPLKVENPNNDFTWKDLLIQIVCISLFLVFLMYFFPMQTDKETGLKEKKPVIEETNQKPSNQEEKNESEKKDIVLEEDGTKNNQNIFQLKNVYVNHTQKKLILRKETPFTLSFQVSSNQTLKEVMIDGTWYSLRQEKVNLYAVNLVTTNISGDKTYVITQMKAKDGTIYPVHQTASITVEKSTPQVRVHANALEEIDGLEVLLSVEDIDFTIRSSYLVTLKNKEGTILSQKETSGENLKVVFESIYDDTYELIVQATYQLYSGYVTNGIIYQGQIENNARYLELKEVTAYNFYKKEDTKVVSVMDLSEITESNKDNYLIGIESNSLPTFYTTIHSLEEKEENMTFRFSTNRFVTYQNGQRKKALEVTLPKIKLLENEIVYDNEKENDTRFKGMKGYDSKRELLYQNLFKIMPFYELKYIVKDGNQIDINHLLNQKELKSVIPLSNGSMNSYLTEHNYQAITQVRLIFQDDTILTEPVKFRSYLDGIASYQFTNLPLFYNYKNYVVKESELVKNLASKIRSFQYDTELIGYKKEEGREPDTRLYNDHYDAVIKTNAEAFAYKLISNQANYRAPIDHEVLTTLIETRLEENHQLEKILFAYTYLSRWYDFEIGGMNLSDILFFDDSLLQNKLDVDSVTEAITLNATIQDRRGKQTVPLFNKIFSKNTGQNGLVNFLEFMIQNYGQYQDVDNWIIDNFKGVAVEMKATNYGDEIRYRIWQLMKAKPYIILPTITIPSNDMYLLGMPSQLGLGSMNIYKEYHPDKPETREVMKQKMIQFGNQVVKWYDTTSKVISDPVKRINGAVNFEIDRRVIWGEIQDPNTTEEPIIKNIYAPLGITPAANGSAAYANGYDVYWVVYDMLNSFSVMTHETVHNQDGRVFLEGTGRRPGTGAEGFTDGAFTQGFGDGSVAINFTYTFQDTSNHTVNLTPERIDSKEKVHDFYKKKYESLNALDYIEAQAFLNSTAFVQSKIGKQNQYTNLTEENQNQASGYIQNKWNSLSESQFQQMNLNSMEDLWNHQIGIYSGNNLYSSYWYLPHNNYGYQNSMFKQMGYELLSVAGYSDGLVAYMGGRSKNDLDALRIATGNQDITYKEYQMNKYREVETKINNSIYFNMDELTKMFQIAMELDAKSSNQSLKNGEGFTMNLRRSLYHYLQRVTNDFETGIYENSNHEVHITSGAQLQQQMKQNPRGRYVLDNDIDVSFLSGTNSITDVTFVGQLIGNGHSISGLSQPLFTKLKYAYIDKVIFKNSTIDMNTDNVGLLAKTSENSVIYQVHIMNSNITGNRRVGSLVGTDTASFLSQISIDAKVSAKVERVGGLIGETNQTAILNSYNRGLVEQLSNQNTGGWYVGGLVGRLYNNSGLYHTYSEATVIQMNTRVPRYAGGLFGKSEGHRSIVSNFSLGNGTNLYRFDGHSNRQDYISGFWNNYEYEYGEGLTNQDLVDFDVTGKLSVATIDNLKSVAFYTNQLGWDATIWNFYGLETGCLPTLNTNVDKNPKISSLKVPLPEEPVNEKQVTETIVEIEVPKEHPVDNQEPVEEKNNGELQVPIEDKEKYPPETEEEQEVEITE